MKNGRLGAINGIGCVRNWSVTDLAEVKEFACSGTRGAKGRRTGIEDWNGSFESYGKTPAVMPGECFDFEGYTGPDDADCGQGTGNGPVYTGEAIVDQVAITWNWDASENIQISTSFSGKGELTIEDDEIVDEETLMVLPTRGSKGFFTFADPTETEICNIASATLTLTADNQTFANSCTAGWRDRNPGIIDWSLAIELQGDERPLVKNSSHILRLYVNATEFFELKWGIVADYSGLTVDIETQAIISQTLNILGQVIDPDDGELGHIILPDLSQFWPAEGSGS